MNIFELLLTPELGYAVQPNSAVATRVSISVSAAKKKQRKKVSLKNLFLVSIHRDDTHSRPSDHLTLPSMSRKGMKPHSDSSISASLLLRQETWKQILGTLLEEMPESLCHAVNC